MSTLVTASQHSVVWKDGYTYVDEHMNYYLLFHYVALVLVMQILDYVNLYRTWAKIGKVRNYFSRYFLQNNHQPKALHV